MCGIRSPRERGRDASTTLGAYGPSNPSLIGKASVPQGIRNADPHFLRTTFDDSPEFYDRARPVPPEQLFDDLVALAQLEPGARLLEIGCGTGQATLPLADRGFEIVGIELGERLADFARRKLAPFPRVKIVASSFEQWNPTGDHFDAVVAFNSFHWIDPELRFARSAQRKSRLGPRGGTRAPRPERRSRALHR
jgi:SAM-dependent methyltransferase